MADEPAETHDASLIWRYSADPPQRFSQNYERYRAMGGPVRIAEFLRTSLAADRGNGNDMARFYFFCFVFELIIKEQLQGDIAELGVYKGGTASLLATFARELNRTAWLMDTFEGFNAADLTGVDSGLPVDFRDTSLASVRALVGEQNVQYVKGYFPETASAIPDR